MSSVKALASLIPAEYRREILLTNMIATALPNQADSGMQYLFNIWKVYINPDESEGCSLCYKRVLDNWKGMHAVLVQLEKEANILKEA